MAILASSLRLGDYMAVSEGVRGLILVAGLVPAGVVLFFGGVLDDAPPVMLLTSCAVCFLVPLGTVRVIAWIVDGFRRGKPQ